MAVTGLRFRAAIFQFEDLLMISSVLPTYARASHAFVRGEGSWLVDEEGHRFLDAGGGIAVSVLGHAHPELVKALKKQADLLWHTSNLYRIPNQERLADLLVEHTFADTVFFTNSGTEATEAAVKMARKYWHFHGNPDRNVIIALKDSFHGRTTTMISASGSAKLTEGFSPLTPGFQQVPPNEIEEVASAIDDSTAAVMVEPILGEGGIKPLSDTFLSDLRQLCDDRDILLIMDEIQTGMGRTGKLFAHEWSGAAPDIMAIAKGIGGGFPLGACLATEKAAAGMVTGTHGSTYGGNPLACAVGTAVMKIVSDQDFLAGVRRRAGYLRQRLEAVVATHPKIFSEIRGTGFMLGVKCCVNNGDFVKAGYDQKLLTVPAGDNVVRLLPPLNISEEELAEAVDRIERTAECLESSCDG